MARVSVQCPGCLAKLNLPDDSKIGKKIKCPKCSDIFVAELDDEEESDEIEDEAPARSGGKRRPGAGKKGAGAKSKSGGGGSTGLLIGGGAVAAIAVIGLILFMLGVFSSKPEPLPVVEQPVAAPPPVAQAPPGPPPMSEAEKILALRWMPTDTETYLHLKVADLWKAPLLKQLVESPQASEALKQFPAFAYVAPTDIDSVSVGVGDMQGIMMTRARGLPTGTGVKMLAVVRSRKPLTLESMLSADSGAKIVEYGGKKYIESPGQQEGVWLPDSTTLVAGSTAELKAAMDRGETNIPRKELLLMDPKSHVVMIVAPKDLKSLQQGAPPVPPDASPEIAAMTKSMQESMTAIGIGVNIRGGFDLNTAVKLRDSQNATTVKTGLDAGIADLRKSFELFKISGQPLFAELGDMLLNNLKLEGQSDTVRLATSIPDSAQEKLEQVPSLLMLMMMTGGANFGGNPFAEGGLTSGDSGPGPRGAGRTGPPPGAYNDGRTDAVDVPDAVGLPEDTSMKIYTASGLPSSNRQFFVELEGSGLGQIVGYGPIEFKSLTLAGGGTAKAVAMDAASKTLVPYNPNELLDHPEGTMRARAVIAPSAEKATVIESVEGSFKILTSAEGQDYVIENAPKSAKRPLTAPGLKAAGVKLLWGRSAVGETLTISCAKGNFLGPVHAVFPKAPLEEGQYWYFIPIADKNTATQVFESPKFPDDLQVHVKVYQGVKEQTVTFKATNVPLAAVIPWDPTGGAGGALPATTTTQPALQPQPGGVSQPPAGPGAAHSQPPAGTTAPPAGPAKPTTAHSQPPGGASQPPKQP
jgi:hypothetical protein